jgi:hypothetical protein
MADEAVPAVEKGSPSARDEGSMPTKAEMAAWTEVGTNAAHVHSAEPTAMHSTAMHSSAMHPTATEAAAAVHDQCKRLWRCAPACYGFINRADLSGIGWHRERERCRSCKHSSFD